MAPSNQRLQLWQIQPGTVWETIVCREVDIVLQGVVFKLFQHGIYSAVQRNLTNDETVYFKPFARGYVVQFEILAVGRHNQQTTEDFAISYGLLQVGGP